MALSSGTADDTVLLEVKTKTKAAEDGFRTVRKVATDEFGKIRETVIKTNALTGESFKTVTERGEKWGEQLGDLARKHQNLLIAAAVAYKGIKEAYELALNAAKKSNSEQAKEFVKTTEQLKSQLGELKQEIGESLIIPMQVFNDQLRLTLGIVTDIARNLRQFLTSDYRTDVPTYDSVGAGITDMYQRAKAYQVGPAARIARTIGAGQGAAFGTAALAGGGALPVEVVKVRAGAVEGGGSTAGGGAAFGIAGNRARLAAEAAGLQAGNDYLAASRAASVNQATLDELAQVGQGTAWEKAAAKLEEAIAKLEEVTAGRDNALFKIFGTPADMAAMAGGLTAIEQAAIAAAPAFNVLQAAVTAAMTAWINGQGRYVKAVKSAIANALAATAIQSGVEALKNTALGVAALATGGPIGGITASGYFAAAKLHAGVAVAAAVGSRALGGTAQAAANAAATGAALGGGYSAAPPGGRSGEGQTIHVHLGSEWSDDTPLRRKARVVNALRDAGALNEGRTALVEWG